MKEVRRTEYDKQPEHIILLGDGTYYYNYDVQEGERYTENGITPIYTAVCVMVQGMPNYNNIVKALIRNYYTTDEEFDLINSYNEAIQEGLTEGKDIIKYKDYLALRIQIKDYVKKDFQSDSQSVKAESLTRK